MKKIPFGLLATILFSNFIFAQSTLPSDADYQIMMNNYATNLNTILNPLSTQQGITVDQLKRKIVSGTFIPDATTKSSITSAAVPLLDYGDKFAKAKDGLTANTDALKYFYSSFAPSTVISGGKLVEGSTGLSVTEMWACALETLGTGNCGSSVLISNKDNLNMFATASISKLTAVSAVGNTGMLVIIDWFGECISGSNVAFIDIQGKELAIVINPLNGKFREYYLFQYQGQDFSIFSTMDHAVLIDNNFNELKIRYLNKIYLFTLDDQSRTNADFRYIGYGLSHRTGDFYRNYPIEPFSILDVVYNNGQPPKPKTKNMTCYSGGSGASECSVDSSELTGGGGCSVKCRDGFYACCDDTKNECRCIGEATNGGRPANVLSPK